jgi:hypothetical protein
LVRKNDSSGEKVKNAQKQHYLSDFGRSDKLFWLEIEKSNPGVSLYSKEMIQSLTRKEEGANGTKRHAVR